MFIRTDQLDGETDWKLRMPITQTQEYLKDKLLSEFNELLNLDWKIEAAKPTGEIYKFEGVFKNGINKTTESLGLEQTLWANTVLASALVVGNHL